MPLEKGMDTPCHGCPDRYTACSDHCQKEAFLKWRQELATIRANREKRRINDGYIVDAIRHSRKSQKQRPNKFAVQ